LEIRPSDCLVDRPVHASRVFLSPQQVGFWLAPFSPVKPTLQTRERHSDEHPAPAFQGWGRDGFIWKETKF